MTSDSDVCQSSTTSTSTGNTYTKVGQVETVILGPPVLLDPKAPRSSTTSASARNKKTKIKPVETVLLKGPSLRSDSGLPVADYIRHEDRDQANRDRPAEGSSLALRFRRSPVVDELGHPGRELRILGPRQHPVDRRSVNRRDASQRTTFPLPTLMPLKVGPPSVFMTGMESPFTPSLRVVVEGESSGTAVEQGATTVPSASRSPRLPKSGPLLLPPHPLWNP